MKMVMYLLIKPYLSDYIYIYIYFDNKKGRYFRIFTSWFHFALSLDSLSHQLSNPSLGTYYKYSSHWDTTRAGKICNQTLFLKKIMIYEFLLIKNCICHHLTSLVIEQICWYVFTIDMYFFCFWVTQRGGIWAWILLIGRLHSTLEQQYFELYTSFCLIVFFNFNLCLIVFNCIHNSLITREFVFAITLNLSSFM